VEILRRYSNLDTFQKNALISTKSLVRTSDGLPRVPSRRPQTIPEEPYKPFKLTQRLKPDTVAEIIAHYEAGEPSTAIATTYGISKGSVIRLLRDAGVPIRKQGLTEEGVAEAARLYASGQSLAQIGMYLGVDHGTVWRQLRKHGVKMRDTHGRPI